MTNWDRMKLIKAGFVLLRISKDELKITKMTGDSSWSTFGKYETKAGLGREIDRINKTEPKIIFEYV